MSVKARFEQAKKDFEKWGINVEEALKKLKNTKISVHCWQRASKHQVLRNILLMSNLWPC